MRCAARVVGDVRTSSFPQTNAEQFGMSRLKLSYDRLSPTNHEFFIARALAYSAPQPRYPVFIQVSANARNAVVIRRPWKSRGVTRPGRDVPLTVMLACFA